MIDSRIEFTMVSLAAMVIEDRAKKYGKSQEKVLRDFRKSNTFNMLFDQESGLWQAGPDYISDMYDTENALHEMVLF